MLCGALIASFEFSLENRAKVGVTVPNNAGGAEVCPESVGNLNDPWINVTS